MAQPRSLSTVSRPPRAHTGTWILVGALLAAAIVAIPVALIYNVFLGRFIRGFTLGAVKG